MTTYYPTLKIELDVEDDPSPGFYDVAQAWSPLAYFRLDQTAGTVAVDSSANGHNGVYTGTYTLNQTSVLADGNASVSLNGTNAFVTIPYLSSAQDVYENLIAPWTLSAWIRPTAARSTDDQFAGIITRDVAALATENLGFGMFYGRSDAAFAAADTVWCGYWRYDVTAGTWLSIADSSTVRLNEWQHYAAVAEVINAEVWLSLYRNGLRVAGPARQAQIGVVGAASRNALIGRRYADSVTAHYFPGRIDEALVWDRALSELEVAKLYASSYSTLTKTTFVELPSVPAVAGQTLESPRVASFSTRRGRSDAVSRVEAGEAMVVLNNGDDLLSPDPIVNLIQNPSFEEDVTSFWNVANATRTRDTTQANWGAASCKLVAAAAGDAYIDTENGALSTGLRPGRTYTFSAYVYVPSGIAGLDLADVFIRLIDVTGSTTTGTTPGAKDAWQRISVTKTIGSAATEAWARVGWNSDSASDYIFIDGCQLEQAGSASTYADGTQTDCRWHGRPHLSPTHRKSGSAYRNILPMRIARLSCDWNAVNYKLIEGPIVSYAYSYPGTKDSKVAIRIVDGEAALAAAALSNFTRPSESVPDRVRAILKAGGIPAAKVSVDDASCDTHLLRAIDEGSVTDTTALAELRKVEETELGLFFVKGDGTHFYHGNQYRDISAREELVLTELGVSSGFTASSYTDTALAYDDQNLINNEAILNEENAWTAEVVAPDSMRRYWPRSSTSSSLFQLPLALSRPRSEAIPRVEPIVVAPAANPSVLWPAVLGLEISDLVRVERTVTRDTLRDYLQWVEGIEHDARPGDWRVKLQTSSEIVTGAAAVATSASGISEATLVSNPASGGDTDPTTFIAGRLYVLFVYQSKAAGPDPATPTVTSPTFTLIRSDTHDAGGSFSRSASFYYLPTVDSVQAPTISDFYTAGYSSLKAIYEVAYGFNAASPIGVNAFSSGSSNKPTVTIGTFAGIHSRGLCFVESQGGGTHTWGRFFELFDVAAGGAFAYSGAYGPEGTNIFTVDRSISETYRMQAVEVKAQ